MNDYKDPEDLDFEDQEEDLYEHLQITVDKGQQALRLDKFLINRLDKVSRNRIQKAIEADNVLVNNTSVKASYKVKPLDHITLVFPRPPREYTLEPEPIPLDIIFEDDEVLVVNKQPGLVVHPGFGNYTGTLVHGLMYHLKDMPHGDGDPQRPGLVHRLDKDTSGLMVVAKTDHALNFLARQFFVRTAKRTYNSLVWGEFDEEEGTITGDIGRNPRFRKKMAILPDGKGKAAITHYKLIENLGYVSLVECRLDTGRTHQIRVHMESIGHPVFNDQTYGGDRIVKGTQYTKYKQFITNCFKLIPRQALHAKSLSFIHPSTQKELFFETELPDDFQAVIAKWRTYFNFLKNA